MQRVIRATARGAAMISISGLTFASACNLDWNSDEPEDGSVSAPVDSGVSQPDTGVRDKDSGPEDGGPIVDAGSSPCTLSDAELCAREGLRCGTLEVAACVPTRVVDCTVAPDSAQGVFASAAGHDQTESRHLWQP